MFRNYVFTLNNYTEEEEELIKGLECKYLVYGHEVGEQGTPHLQGYIEFKQGKRVTTLHKTLPRVWFKERAGTAKQAADYCKKSKDFYEKGEISKQGHRSDLDHVASMVAEGKSLKDIAEEVPATFIRYNRGIEALKCITTVDRDPNDPPCVMWLWGETGVGKTRAATETFDSYYIKDCNTKWWNGYEQQTAIIIDDFNGKWDFENLLRLLDRYPYQGETKGGHIKINSPIIIITCSRAPNEIWGGKDLAQIERRLNNNIFKL